MLVCVEMGFIFSFAFVAAYWLRAGSAPLTSRAVEHTQAREKRGEKKHDVGGTTGAVGTSVASKVAEEKVGDEAPTALEVKATKKKKRRTRKSAD